MTAIVFGLNNGWRFIHPPCLNQKTNLDENNKTFLSFDGFLCIHFIHFPGLWFYI